MQLLNCVRIQIIALLGVAALAGPALAQTGDHVACYKVKDRAKHGVFTLTLTLPDARCSERERSEGALWSRGRSCQTGTRGVE